MNIVSPCISSTFSITSKDWIRHGGFRIKGWKKRDGEKMDLRK
jgi:hypothetical protein